MSVVHVLNKPQTYPLPKCFRRRKRCCLMALMIIWRGMHFAPTAGWERKICAVSVWRSGCYFLKNDDRTASVSCLSLSLSAAALPVTGRGSIPHISGKLQRTSKILWPVILSTSGHWKKATKPPRKNNDRTGRDSASGRVETRATVWRQWRNPGGLRLKLANE